MTLAAWMTGADAQPARPGPGDVLRTLRPGHPRLHLRDEDMARIQRGIASDERLARLAAEVRKEAVGLLEVKPVEYIIVGPRLLTQSRNALKRVSTLALAHRLAPDQRLVDRAVREMEAAAAFKDWNPSHFLDTAEMTNALAIGYDWLYKDLTPAQRATIRTAIVEKGLKPGLKVYDSGRGWQTSRNNWNQVCNGGLTAGALAIADEEPELAAKILTHAVASIQTAMASFAPDGGWEEGPGYWSYATQYNIFFLSALDTALGTDFGLCSMPGFAQAGDFRMHTAGPTGKSFNFADAGETVSAAPQMFWFGHRFENPLFLIHELAFMERRGSAAHLIFSAGSLPTDTSPRPPLDAVFRRVQVACFRSSWDDPNALFVGFKGGDNQAGHSHLDLGTFVLDALGQRWAVDLGGDDYNLPGYFGGKRWDYFRLRTEGHNTLTLDGENQEPRAKAPLLSYSSTPSRSWAVADLSEAYPGKASRVWRGVTLEDRRSLLVQDELELTETAEVGWNMLTSATIRLDGRRAVLEREGQSLLAEIVAGPPEARFEEASATPAEPQNQNEGIRKLVVRIQAASGRVRLAVRLTPGGTPPEGAGEPAELAELVREAPLKPLEESDR